MWIFYVFQGQIWCVKATHMPATYAQTFPFVCVFVLFSFFFFLALLWFANVCKRQFDHGLPSLHNAGPMYFVLNQLDIHMTWLTSRKHA